MRGNMKQENARTRIGDYIYSPKRLEELKYKKFLTKRILTRISENMHYEIFKYLDGKDLLEVRAITLGGYQLTTNKILRSRIGNYLESKIYLTKKDIEENINRIKLIFQFQKTSNYSLNLGGTQIGNQGLVILTKVLKSMHDIYISQLYTCIYIYILIRTNKLV